MWKVSSRFRPDASSKENEAVAEEDSQAAGPASQGETGPVPEQQEKDAAASPDPAKKSFVCKACDKSFHFYCRLKVHTKRCRVAKNRQAQREASSGAKEAEEGPGTHQLQAHSAGAEPDVPKKKKKRLPVTCDLCGREFAHASGTTAGVVVGDASPAPVVC